MKYTFALIALAVASSLLPNASAGEVACKKSFADVFQAVAPSVVRVFAVGVDPFSATKRVQANVGTGVVIDESAHIVTNAHIVYDASVVMVGLSAESMQRAQVVGVDLVSDLAVLRPAVSKAGFRPAPFGQSGKLRVGQEVLAIGHPFGIAKSATKGIVSGVGRVLPISALSWMTPFVQTDAPLSPGNSGGPLVSRCGHVIAINTLAGKIGQNINFAIPIDLVRQLTPQLISKGRIVRAWHGIRGQLVSRTLHLAFRVRPGFLIETIEPGSPAQKIGLRGGNFPVVIGAQRYLLGGDVISKVNGVRLANMATVFQIAKSLRIGDEVELEVWRGPLMKKFKVVLVERPVLPGDAKRFRSPVGRN